MKYDYRNIIRTHSAFSRLLMVFGIVVLVGSNSFSQEKSYLGVKAGINFANGYFRNQFFSRNMQVGAKQGFNAGLMYKAIIGKHAGIQVDLGYIEKGWRQTFEDEVPDFVTDLNYGRIQFSSFFHFSLDKGRAKIYLSLGPFVDRLLSSGNNEWPDFDYLNQRAITFFVFEEDRDFKVGYGIGGAIGFSRKAGIGNVFVEGTLSVSLGRIIDSGPPDLNTPEVLTDQNGNTLEVQLPNISGDFTYGVSFGYEVPLSKSVE